MNLLTPRTAWTGPSRCDVCGHVQADFEPMIAIQRTYMTYCGDCYDQYLFERHWWPISRADAVRILKTANLHYLVEQIPASGTFYRSLRRTPWSEWMNLSVALKDDTHIGWIESAAIGWLRTIVARQILRLAAQVIAQGVRRLIWDALTETALALWTADQQREQQREAERRSRKPVQLALPIAG